MTPHKNVQSPRTAVCFQHVSYSYARQERCAVSELSFSVNRGEFLGILGADDAGKTTIAKLANGLILPSKGQITLADVQTRGPSEEFRRDVGVIFSDPENQIIGTTVEEDIAFGLGNLRVPSDEMRIRVDVYLQRVGLLKYAKRSPCELSAGEQQKLCIASVLAMEPECLVLDEPLGFLDSESRGELLELLVELNKDGKTMIYLSSNPEELLWTDRLIVLHKGTILTECSISTLWNNFLLLEKSAICPSDMMIFRDTLRRQGYHIQEDSLTPEAIVNDIWHST